MQLLRQPAGGDRSAAPGQCAAAQRVGHWSDFAATGGDAAGVAVRGCGRANPSRETMCGSCGPGVMRRRCWTSCRCWRCSSTSCAPPRWPRVRTGANPERLPRTSGIARHARARYCGVASGPTRSPETGMGRGGYRRLAADVVGGPAGAEVPARLERRARARNRLPHAGRGSCSAQVRRARAVS